MANPVKPSDMHQLVKTDQSVLKMSDDTVMMKQIQATHSPDGREIDVKPLLLLVEDILNHATLNVDTVIKGSEAHTDMEDKTHQAAFIGMLDALSYTIDKLSCEIAYKALSGTDAHATTLSLCNILSSYPWDAKLVLMLAAFALNYGEFWLLAQIYPTNQLAKSMAIVKQLPTVMEHAASLKPRFDALNNLIRAMMEVTRLIVEFKELPSSYISQEVPAFSTVMGHIPTAVYWTIRSVVACATQITTLTTMGHEHIMSTIEAWETSTLAHKLNNIHDHLKTQLQICYQHIEEKRNIEAYQLLIKLFETIHINNMKVLKALIDANDNILPLVDGQTKKRVNIEVLRGKNVLLLISGLNMPQEELSILEQIYRESRFQGERLERDYVVVWIPVVDPSAQFTEETEKQFETQQATMPWYSVYHPKLIQKPVIRFFKEVWHLKKKPILVVLDPQGRVVCPNAKHMMWIWGSTAFPFTSTREEALWRREIWRLELLVDAIDQTISNWIREEKYIFLYGGDDIEWIRKFTNTARAVALAANIPLEMVYVGKSIRREKVRRVIATVTVEKLSYCWQDLTTIWFFWTRLESMLFSKIQLGKEARHDSMLREIERLLSYDKEGGWAILCKGSNVVVTGHSTTVLPALLEYDIWKEHVKVQGFDLSFKDHHDKLHGITPPCCRFEFSSTLGRIPESMECPECFRIMEKFITFLCCHDDPTSDVLHETTTVLAE